MILDNENYKNLLTFDNKKDIIKVTKENEEEKEQMKMNKIKYIVIEGTNNWSFLYKDNNIKYKICMFVIFFIFFLVLGENKAFATPGNVEFKDDILYQAIIDKLNSNNVNSINDRDINYTVTDEELKTIKSLDCGSIENRIEDMSGINKLTELKSLSINYPLIKELDISQNVQLTYLNVLNASNLNEIDFTNNINLKNINLTYTHLKNLNLQNCTELKYLYMGAGVISDAKIEQLDVSNCEKLEELTINGSKLIKIDLSNNHNLKKVTLTGGKITDIILPKSSYITELNVHENEIQSLSNIENLETCNSLQRLLLAKNHIMDITLLKNISTIVELYMAENTDIIQLNKRGG